MSGGPALAQSSPLHVAFAFLAMGGWAALANSGHAWPAPLVAGILQGALSGAITLVLKRMVEAIVRRMSGPAALLTPPAVAGLSSGLLLTTIHALAGTPEIFRTIALPLTISTGYAALYARTLRGIAREPR